MRKIKYLLSAAVTSVVLMAGMVLPKVVLADGPQVTICHGTDSASNPYQKIDVDVDGLNGHGDHTGPLATSEEVANTLKDAKTQWGDIIPPTTDLPSGLNWTATGQAMLENDCNFVQTVTPAAVTTVAPTCDASGTYTIPTTEGVEYKIDGTVVAAGTYTATNGTTVTVTADALKGFVIEDGATVSWTNDFVAPTNCTTTPVTPPTTGQVLGTQVTVKPTGAVKAGGGGASAANSSALVGLVGSVSMLGLGLIRKWTA